MLYHNRFNLDIGSLGALIGGQRSGGAIIHDNETTGARPTTYPSLGNPAVFRENTRAATWGFAEGSNPWDVNVNGGQLFESGTATIGSVMGVVKDSTKHWMPGRWEGYSITDLDAPHPFNGSAIPAGTIPAQVTSAYPASVNGGSAYTQDFIYPHPLQGAGNPTPTPTPTPTATP